MRKRTISVLVLGLSVALTASLFHGYASAETLQAGSLDPSFGSGGVGEELRVMADEDISGRNVVVQPDGRIMILAGETGRRTYLMVRYNSDGTVDRTFGINGEARTTARVSTGTRPPVMATQLVDGVSRTLVHVDADILRYDENGNLDESFGSAGEARSPNGHLGWTRDIEVNLAQDRILALTDPAKMGVSLVYTGYDPQPQAIYAFTRDGQPDESFGIKGMTLLGAPIMNPTGLKDLALQADGKIVVSGGSLTARLLPNGDLDEAFGDEGIVIDVAEDYRWNQRVEVDAQERILVMRCYHRNTQTWGEQNGGCEMIRYLPDGSRDMSYGEAGSAQLTAEGSENFEIDSQGRAVIFGRMSPWNIYTVLRLLPDGMPDPAFGQAGLATTEARSDTAAIGQGALQADDKPVRVGTLLDTIDWELELKIWRYLAEPVSTEEDPAPAQTDATLVGRVTDAKTDVGVSGATIDCEGRITMADGTGAYSILLPVGTHWCHASATGYRSSKARIDVTTSGATQDFKLR